MTLPFYTFLRYFLMFRGITVFYSGIPRLYRCNCKKLLRIELTQNRDTNALPAVFMLHDRPCHDTLCLVACLVLSVMGEADPN